MQGRRLMAIIFHRSSHRHLPVFASALRRGFFIQPMRPLYLAPNVQVLLYRRQVFKQV
jgi:hypothetical protein